MREFKRAFDFWACLNIRPTMPFEETVALLGRALGISFSKDQSGKYEEYPAYCAFALGLEIAVLAPPLPKYETRDEPHDYFQLIVNAVASVDGDGVDVDLSDFIEAQLKSCTDLVIEDIDD